MENNEMIPDDVEDAMDKQMKFMDEFIKKRMEYMYWLGFRNGLEIFKDAKTKEFSNTANNTT